MSRNLTSTADIPQTAQPAVLKPGQVLRLTNRGKLPKTIDGGQCHCQKCRKPTGGATESPTFWENGSYTYCPHCKLQTLARPIYPPVEGYPHGIAVDCSGERRKYPMILPQPAAGPPLMNDRERAVRLAISILDSFKEAGGIYDDYQAEDGFTDDDYDMMLAELRLLLPRE